MDQSPTGYDVGALMYSPANAHGTIVDALKNERIPHPFSLAFCLEDTVREEAVEEAEKAAELEPGNERLRANVEVIRKKA